jgi:tRNA (Thr-GGU) A37 N-methylase
MDRPNPSVDLEPIGTVVGGRLRPTDDGWDAERCTIELDAARFDPDSLAGLAEFSHVEVVFLFHLVDEADVVPGCRHPRERTDWPRIGIFAQRGRVRPNRLGVTVCRLESVEGTSVRVRGLDAVEGTPVLDLKPYLSGCAPRGEVREPPWAREIMEGYW